MSIHIYIILDNPPSSRVLQSAETTSFVGGRPKIPSSVELPTCKLCGAIQTFFFQVAFPDRHAWAGQSLAVFECTSCDDPRYSLPTMKLHPIHPGDDIPDGSLDDYQSYFRLPTFPTNEGVIRADYDERIRFSPITLVPGKVETKTRSKVGGRPRWINGDMTPGNYEGEPLHFLMQWEDWFDFPTHPDAPERFRSGFTSIKPKTKINYYNLLAAYELYFFGNRVNGKSNVYLFPQSS